MLSRLSKGQAQELSRPLINILLQFGDVPSKANVAHYIEEWKKNTNHYEKKNIYSRTANTTL